MKTFFAALLGITVGALGCSDDSGVGKDELGIGGTPTGGNGGSGATVTGGTPNGTGPTGGATAGNGTPQPTGEPGSTNGEPTPAGTPVGAGGVSTGGIGGSGAGGSDTPGPDLGGAGSGTGGAAVDMSGAGNTPGSAGVGGSDLGGSGMGGSGNTSGSAGIGGDTGVGGAFTGTCTEPEGAGTSVSGSGPHEVVVETNSEDGINCGTIYRPADMGGDEKYPILVWGEGGCSQDGLSNRAAMGEIASWGYFIVADGTPGGENSCAGGQSGAAFLDYITWAIAENDKPCSPYYRSLETTKIAADGFSCGGLMAENVAGDPRFTAIGITSSGLMGANNDLWDSMHAPFKIMNGGSSDVAYENGLNDYEAISSRGIPILYFSQTSAGHGGDLFQARGDFNLVNLAWLNWQLKGDEGATGKAFLIGDSCEFCNDSGWEFMSANIE